jgi:hypothetical protein
MNWTRFILFFFTVHERINIICQANNTGLRDVTYEHGEGLLPDTTILVHSLSKLFLHYTLPTRWLGDAQAQPTQSSSQTWLKMVYFTLNELQMYVSVVNLRRRI